MFSIQQALDAYFNRSIGTYGGSQAGSGTYGVEGAGVISRFADGRVFSENGTRTQTLPDGTQITRVIEDGQRNELVKRPDGSVTLIQGDQFEVHYDTTWADGRVTSHTYVETDDVRSENVVQYFPGGLKIREYIGHTSGVYKREEYDADGNLFRRVWDKPGEYKKEYKLNEDGSWSQQTSFYKSGKIIDFISYEFHQKNAEIAKVGDYLTYDYESQQNIGGPKKVTETTSYYTGNVKFYDVWPSRVEVKVVTGEWTELPDGSVIPGNTDRWDARYLYDLRDHPNVEIPPPEPRPTYLEELPNTTLALPSSNQG